MPGADPATVCVYTSLIGQYEDLNEQPVRARSAMPFICITDDPHLTSASWEIRLVDPIFPMDPIRSQRDVKLRPHVHLPEFEGSIYIDNSVVLTAPPEAIWARRPSGAGFALPRHSYRETVMDEFLEVSRLGMDDQTRIFEQLNHYLLSNPDVLDQPPFWCGILLRDHGDEALRRTMDIWMAHLCRYSRRDQLSINMALHLAGFAPHALDLDNFLSPFHRWPVAPRRDREKGPRNIITNLKPLAARVHELEQSARSLTESLEESHRAKAAAHVAYEQEVARLVEIHLQDASVARAAYEREFACLVEIHGRDASEAHTAYEREIGSLMQVQERAAAEAMMLHDAEVARLQDEHDLAQRHLTEQHAATAAHLRTELSAMRRARTWRVMEPVRQASARLPIVRSFVRGVLRRLR